MVGERRPLAWLLVAVLLGCSTTHATQEPGPPPSGPALPVAPVGHQGRWLTDAEGRVLLIHGVNMVQKDAPYTPASAGFSDADAAWLATNGFLVVRVGILATGLMPTPGVVDTGYIQQVAATVSDLAQNGIYSLIDFHQDGFGPAVGSDGFPAVDDAHRRRRKRHRRGFPLYYEQNPALQQAFQSFWNDARDPDDAGLEDDYAAMFSAVAKQLAGQPYVLGYDLFNEPWPGTTWSACLNDPGGCPTLDTGELGPAYAKAVSAIRAAGDHHLVFGEPFNLFNFGLSTTSIPSRRGLERRDELSRLPAHAEPGCRGRRQRGLVVHEHRRRAAQHRVGRDESAETLVPESVALDSALVPWIFWSFCCELVPSLQAGAGGDEPRRLDGEPSSSSPIRWPSPALPSSSPWTRRERRSRSRGRRRPSQGGASRPGP
jgi:endoglycosylceramidase